MPPDASARGQGIFLGSGLATVLELSYSRFRCAQLGARDWESAGLDFDFCLGILVFLRSRVERGLSFFFFSAAIIDTDSDEKTHAPLFEGWGGGGEGGGGNVF